MASRRANSTTTTMFDLVHQMRRRGIPRLAVVHRRQGPGRDPLRRHHGADRRRPAHRRLSVGQRHRPDPESGQGLEPDSGGVRLMKPISSSPRRTPARAKCTAFVTKMRSTIAAASPDGGPGRRAAVRIGGSTPMASCRSSSRCVLHQRPDRRRGSLAAGRTRRGRRRSRKTR